MSTELTGDELREKLDYNAATGIFTWKISPSAGVKIGDIAGCMNKGYRQIRIFGKQYYAHRLAWLYIHNRWPREFLDHENGVRSDNRIDNLREASRAQNNRNRRKDKDSASNYKGVCWHRASGKWQAQITCNGRRSHLGVFDTAEDAYEFYCLVADMAHGEFANHG